jgi:hypothetical protein
MGLSASAGRRLRVPTFRMLAVDATVVPFMNQIDDLRERTRKFELTPQDWLC